MEARRILGVGGLGAIVSVIVCFTPLVVAILAGVGLSSWFGSIDLAFHGVLVFSVGAVGYGLYRLRSAAKRHGT